MVTHAERIVRLEAEGENRDDRLERIEATLDNIELDLRAVRDAMLRGQGATSAHKHMSGRLQAWLTLAGSLFGGGIGALMLKKFG